MTAKRIKEYPIHKIKPCDPMEMNLKEYISEVFRKHGDEFAEMIFKDRLSNQTETTIIINLSDKGNWNKKELKISLRDVE